MSSDKVQCVGGASDASRAQLPLEQALRDHDVAGQGSAMHPVLILQTGETFFCHGTHTLLQGMARMGRKGIPTGCLNGGCGVCKVAIRRGSVKKTGPMSRAYISEEDEAQGLVLACRVVPAGAVELEVVGKIQKAVFGIERS